MTFPYPQNPQDWQSAYTKDHGHRDSNQYANRYMTPVFFLSLFVIGFYLFGIAIYALDLLSRGRTAIIWGFLIIFILSMAGLLAAYTIAIRFGKGFFSEFYHPPDGFEVEQLINYRLYGLFNYPPPISMFVSFKYILVKDGGIEKQEGLPGWMSRYLGGPLTMIVFDGCALYLERGSRFSRVVGPGVPFLEWFETIKYVIDLRPQTKEDTFDAWTKDGIKIKITAKIECRVGDPAKKDPKGEHLYPFDPVAAKKAVERFAVRWPDRQNGQPSEFTWIDACWGQVTGIVPGYIGSRMLDDLVAASRQSGQILAPDAMKEIFGKLNGATQAFGCFVTEFQILKVKMPDEVEDLLKEYWKAEKQSIITRTEGDAKAQNIRTREKARAEAQHDLILAIADGLGSYKNRDGQFSEPLLLSLSGILDESLSDPLMRAYLAKETLETLETLQTMLKKDHD
jgi:hypothetical protein